MSYRAELDLQSAHWNSANAGFELYDDELNDHGRNNHISDASDFIVDIREYDVPYHVRVAIDKGLDPQDYRPVAVLMKKQTYESENGIRWRPSTASQHLHVLKSVSKEPILWSSHMTLRRPNFH